jgi:hypothetical protein
MAFNPTSLPPSVYEAYKSGPLAWPLVVQRAVDEDIRDLDRLTSIVFYLHHPERNGRKIAANESDMIDQYNGFKALIGPMVPAVKKPHKGAPAPPAVDWSIDDTEAWNIRKQWGQELLDWAQIPPDGTEAREFSPIPSLQDNYTTVFAWKSTQPKTSCVANPGQRLQLLAMLRDDKAYWDRHADGSRIASAALRSAAATAIADYRDYIVNRKMCPRAAYNRLVQVNKDVIYEMFIGMFQLLSPQGVPNALPAHTQAFAEGIAKIVERLGEGT